MIYPFKCQDCGLVENISLPIARRDQEQLCVADIDVDGNVGPCCGKMVRDFKAQLGTQYVATWKFWCDSTRSDFEPSHAEREKQEKDFEAMAATAPKKAVSTKELFNKVRRETAGMDFRAEKPEEIKRKAAEAAKRSAA